jgi:hypothetical protein
MTSCCALAGSVYLSDDDMVAAEKTLLPADMPPPPPYSPPQNDTFAFEVLVTGLFVAWIVAGTTFYHCHNNWPWDQAFYYLVSAGMSIGWWVTGTGLRE